MTRPSRGEIKSAVSVLYIKHAKRIRAHACKAFLGDLTEADEVVQETFLAAYRQFERDLGGKYAEEQAAWLTGVANHKILDRFAQRRLETPSEDVAEVIDGPGDLSVDPVARMVNREMSEKLWQTISERLTDGEYRVAFMSFELEMEDAAIASCLRTTATVIRTHRCRAKQKIKEAIATGIIFPDDPRAVEGGAEVRS